MVKKIKVGYVMPIFGQLSETFIYNYAKDTASYDAYVFTLKRENASLFPHSRVTVVQRIQDLTAAIAEVKPDILHAHYGPVGLWLLPSVIEHKIPLITMFHGHDATSLLREPSWITKYQLLFDYASKITAVSNTLRNNLINAGCPREKIIIFRPSVETVCFNLTPPTVEDTVRFLTCSRHVEKKGMRYVLKAFAALVKEMGEKVALSIIGEGPLTNDLKDMADKLALGNQVQFLGPQPSSTVLDEMKQCHIFIQASVTAENGDMEGTPVVIAEAMATGRPIIGTYHSGIPEMVKHKKTGFLTREKDVDGLLKYMRILAQDPKLREEMGKAGRKFVEEEFSAHVLREKLATLYQEVIQSFSPSSDKIKNKKEVEIILIYRVVPMCNLYYHLLNLKKLYPESRIIVFSPDSTAHSCEVAPFVDEVVVNKQNIFSVSDCEPEILEDLKEKNISQAIIPFSGEKNDKDKNLIELSSYLGCKNILLIDDKFNCSQARLME